ncbi:S-adenosylmethionine:tRNA ribosyltransferase-isomerase [Bacteroidia bacterium]|nr:S-adenosylmethionine:tRNA ribosyltransferase-isomerase [Bacteroidia bacterium]
MKITDAKKKLHEFHFNFSEDMIAMKPARFRDDAKLLVVNREKDTIEHHIFRDVINYFNAGDVFVLNDSRVFPGLLEGKKEKKEDVIAVTLLRELGADKEEKLWDVIVDPARKIRLGNNIFFGENSELVAEVIDNTSSRGRTIRFQYDGTYQEFMDLIMSIGSIPMPPYLAKKGRSLENLDLTEDGYASIEEFDADRYQNIYAKTYGAKLSPSAGLNFSKQLMLKCQLKDIEFANITLHPGLSNLEPIKVEDLNKHKPASEEISVSEEACNIINHAKDNNRKIVAVGTTTMKGLEAATITSNRLREFSGWTHKFIFPPYTFQLCDALITGFHLPATQMFLQVAAFGGLDLVKDAYNEAIKNGYKFMAYGDAMLII